MPAFSCRIWRIGRASPRLRGRLLSSILVVCWLAAALTACQRGEPPGNQQSGTPTVALASWGGDLASGNGLGSGKDEWGEAETLASQSAPEPGSKQDNLPFSTTGEKLASIAWRTWIYTDTGPQRTRLGYLRAGEIVERRGPPIVNDGCAGGWYRINPRGFVCLGKGATLDLQHPVVVATGVRARRDDGLPYTYALSKETAPHFYFRLPTRRQMREVEGEFSWRAARWLAARKTKGEAERIGLRPAPPSFLRELEILEKPYGTEQRLRHSVHSGQASADSGFALLRTFEYAGRGWGLTTELDLIPMDRTTLAEPSEMTGLVLGKGEGLPVAHVTGHWLSEYRRKENGQMEPVRAHPRRSLLKLTGKQFRAGVRHWETSKDHFVPEVGVRILSPRQQFPSVATGSRKWIDISINHQTLVAYEGRKPVFVTLVSTGAGGLGDPEKVPSTIQGTFMVHAKHVTATMNGQDDDQSDSFNLRDVPFVQYFHRGYALHAAYWHDDFGRWRSHGCINLAPKDAAWLFEWTDPAVPEGWHSVMNKQRGTVVHIHP